MVMALRIRTNALQRAARVALPAMVLSAGFGAGASANVLVSSGATTNITCTSGVCTPTKGGAVLNASQLVDMLASGNVKITTDGAKASNIMINAPLSWASGSVLTLDAYQSVIVNKSVSVTGAGGVSIVTDDGGTGGVFSFGPKGLVTFLSLSSPLTINGAAYTLVDDIATLASDIAATPSGNFALAGSYNASADGTYASSPIPTTFTGNFQGLHNTISNLAIEASTGSALGLFENLDTGGTIENLNLARASIAGTRGTFGTLVAINRGTLLGDTVDTKITGSELITIGGLAGDNYGFIESCSAQGKVVGSKEQGDGQGDMDVGGLVGFNEDTGTILDSYSTASVSAGKLAYAGGLVGDNAGMLSNSFATGAVQAGPKSDIGSLVGVDGGPYGFTVTDAYGSGALSFSVKESHVGGLVGIGGSYTRTYWDTTTTGITNPSQGVGYPSNVPGVTGLTTSQLQSGLPAGFSSAVWGESASINGGLPYLLALPPT
jgi:hypothetical protein